MTALGIFENKTLWNMQLMMCRTTCQWPLTEILVIECSLTGCVGLLVAVNLRQPVETSFAAFFENRSVLKKKEKKLEREIKIMTIVINNCKQ